MHLQTCSPSNHGIKHLGYLLFWPVPVAPVAFEPLKTFGFTGEYAPNHALEKAERITLPDGEIGREDLAVMSDGTVYTTDQSGRLYRIDGVAPVMVDQLGGLPLGLKAGPAGALYIADSFRIKAASERERRSP